jgi:hypothetical protein
MRALFILVAVVLTLTLASPVLAQSPADPTGHWEGTITAPMGQIDFEVDVVRDGSGTLVATYGQKGQGVRGLKLTQVALDGRTFAFVLFDGGPGGGVFKAEILSDSKTMSGEVKATRGTVPFMAYRTGEAAMLPAVKNPAVTKGLEGTWTGTLDVGGTPIALILAIANRPDGTASVLIAQVARPEVQVDAALKEDGSAVSFEVPATSGSWAGTFDGNALSGTWTQSGGSLPLTLTRAR